MKARLNCCILLLLISLLAMASASFSQPRGSEKAQAVASVSATVETDPVPTGGDAADDIAVWIHPIDVSLSTVIGTDKRGGGMAVYNMDGSEIQFISAVEPNNVDIRYNFMLSGVPTTLVCFSDEAEDAIGIYAVDPNTRLLYDVAAGQFEPGYGVYGFAMYYSAVSGKYYSFIGSQSGVIQQWELYDNGAGKVAATLVRSLSVGSQAEGMVADDFLGHLYVSEEDVGVWKFSAEPDGGNTPTFVDGISPNGHLNDDIEGSTIYYRGDGTGYLIISSQGADEYVVYEREGNNNFITSFEIVAGNGIDDVSDTDGIDVSNFNLGPLFPQGAFIAQDGTNEGANQNFKLVPWDVIANATTPQLVIDTSWDPRLVGALPPDDPPAAPTNLEVESKSSDSIDLSWLDNANNETGFKIERKSGAGAFAEIASVGVDVQSYSDTGLSANTLYNYRVRAFAGAVFSDYSNEDAAQTYKIFSLTTATSGSGSVALDPSGGSYDSSAVVTLTANGNSGWRFQQWSGDLGGNANPATLTMDSDKSVTASFEDIAAPAISNVTASVITHGGATITWDTDEPADTQVEYGTDTNYGDTTPLDATLVLAHSQSLTGLQPGTAYHYRVHSRDAAGLLATSSDHTFTTAAGPPPSPPSNLIAASSGTTSIDLIWADNSTDESGFKIERKSGAGAFAEIASTLADVTGFSDVGLQPATEYVYRVRAFNAFGESAYSNPDSATTDDIAGEVNLALNKPASASFNAPAYPPQNAVDGDVGTAWGARTNSGDQWLHVDLQNQETVGKAIIRWNAGFFATDYELQLSSDDANWVTVFATAAGNGGNDTLTFVQTNAQFVRLYLQQGGSQFYAVNELEVYEGQPLSSPPDAPDNLTAAAVSTSQIDLSWSDNSNNEAGFAIERKPDAGAYSEIAILPVDATSFSDTGLPMSSRFFYRVRAFNAVDSSGYSNEVSATTFAGNQPPVAIITQPSNGQIFTVGQTVNFAGTGSDPEDGVLPAANFRWFVTTPSGNTVPLGTGISSGSGRPNNAGAYTLRLEVDDSGGLTGTDAVSITAVSSSDPLLANSAAVEWVDLPISRPVQTQFLQAFPNPFNPSTAITYQIAQQSRVQLEIYNLLGQHVRTLVDAVQQPGSYRLEWDGRDQFGRETGSGIYIYALQADQTVMRKRLVKLK